MEVPLFVKAKLGELSTELAGCADTLESVHSGKPYPEASPSPIPSHVLDSPLKGSRHP